jgi:hypothetical protein
VGCLAFVDGAPWPIVAANPRAPYKEIRVKLGAHVRGEMVGNLLVLDVRLKALVSDCERAAETAKAFTKTVGRDTNSKK